MLINRRAEEREGGGELVRRGDHGEGRAIGVPGGPGGQEDLQALRPEPFDGGGVHFQVAAAMGQKFVSERAGGVQVEDLAKPYDGALGSGVFHGGLELFPQIVAGGGSGCSGCAAAAGVRSSRDKLGRTRQAGTLAERRTIERVRRPGAWRCDHGLVLAEHLRRLRPNPEATLPPCVADFRDVPLKKDYCAGN